MVRDADLLALAHEEARRPGDGDGVPPALAAHVARVWQQQFGLVTVG